MTRSKLTLCSIAALLATGQAFAHTGVRDVVTESLPSPAPATSSYNGFTITHGCGDENGQPYPVLGQSALFPFGSQAVWKDAAGNLLAVGGDGAGTIVPTAGIGLNLAVTGYAGQGSGFATTEEIVDDLGRVHALLWKNGAMQPQLNSITPFKITAPKIANNCVKSLKVRIGVINYCDVFKNEANDGGGNYPQPKDAFGRKIPMLVDVENGESIQANVNGSPVYQSMAGGNGDNNRQDWWFTAPHGGSNLFKDDDLLQPTYWTTMTINNSQADINACVASGGTPADVSVEPSGVDFDTYLSVQNTQPFTKGNGPL